MAKYWDCCCAVNGTSTDTDDDDDEGCLDFFAACLRCKLRLLCSDDDSETLPLVAHAESTMRSCGEFAGDIVVLLLVRRRVRVRFLAMSVVSGEVGDALDVIVTVVGDDTDF